MTCCAAAGRMGSAGPLGFSHQAAGVTCGAALRAASSVVSSVGLVGKTPPFRLLGSNPRYASRAAPDPPRVRLPPQPPTDLMKPERPGHRCGGQVFQVEAAGVELSAQMVGRNPVSGGKGTL